MRKHLFTLVSPGLAAALFLTLPVAATATPSTDATYLVTVSNAAGNRVAFSHDEQQSFAPQLMALSVAGMSDSATTINSGFAAGSALGKAAPGVLRASAFAESQAVAQPNTGVGASVVSNAIVGFTDSLVFSSSSLPPLSVLTVKGELVLTGSMYRQVSGGSGYVSAEVGGTGLHPSLNNPWLFEINRQGISRMKSPAGDYSSWTPGDPVIVPFSFSVLTGVASEMNYWLRAHAESASIFSEPCVSFGGLCTPTLVSNVITGSDYHNTLAWGGVSVTDRFGNPVAFTVSSYSGFDYSTAYVPEPGTASLLLIGLSWMGWRPRRSTDHR